jgi:hypothetical protein
MLGGRGRVCRNERRATVPGEGWARTGCQQHVVARRRSWCGDARFLVASAWVQSLRPAAVVSPAGPHLALLAGRASQALKRWRLMLKALAPECRGSFGAAVQEAAHRIWGAARMAAAAEAAGQQDKGTAE